MMNSSSNKHELSNEAITIISSNEELISFIKAQFSRLDSASAIKLIRIIIKDSYTRIEARNFKLKYTSFIGRNKNKFDVELGSNGKNKYYLKDDIINIISNGIFDLLNNINSSIKEIDENDLKWSKVKIDGNEVFETTRYTTFQDVREKIDNEGKDVMFRYPFDESDLEKQPFENKLRLQMVDAHINDSGESFGFPLKYTYVCPECGHVSTRMEYEVASTSHKIKCPNMIEKEDSKGNPVIKKCGLLLAPDENRTETKNCYIHSVSFDDKDGVNQKGSAISFLNLPKGVLTVVLQKIPSAYAKPFVHIVDYKPIKKQELVVPEREPGRHLIFTYIDAIDKYIANNTGYVHYGFLPMKIGMLIQYFARYIPGMKRNFHLAMVGSMSGGKTAFSKYWSLTLYGQNAWCSNATSISIARLRGTMESLDFFGKSYRYQSKGLFGEMDCIVIDELKENPDVKSNLKQYAVEAVYEYSKAGGSNQTYERTAQLVVTENIDTTHLYKYTKEIMKLYTSQDLQLDTNDDDIKPAWDYSIDLTLPLYAYDNKYLRYSIMKVREDYTRNQRNWIDGSELALKQRFFFYFYLSSEKTNKELKTVIRGNSTRKIISNNIELMRLLGADSLKQIVESRAGLEKGTNDLEYFEKIDKLLELYNKRTDARTTEMSYTMLKILRMMDGRNYCTQSDLDVFQYILEAIDNKIEVVDTNEFKINGPHKVEDTGVVQTSDEWNYQKDIGEFTK